MTKDQLKKIMPRLPEEKIDLYFPYLFEAMQMYEINTVLREAAFLAQIAHESVELRYMEEIASGGTYEGRTDLGNTQPGDGKRYKGRGPIQLTGRRNYKKFGDLMRVDLVNHPEKAVLPEYCFKIAGLYWKLRKLNVLADAGRFREITRRINGGLNGLEDRMKYYALAKQVLTQCSPKGINSPQAAVKS